jgi:hypothetical protein
MLLFYSKIIEAKYNLKLKENAINGPVPFSTRLFVTVLLENCPSRMTGVLHQYLKTY